MKDDEDFGLFHAIVFCVKAYLLLAVAVVGLITLIDWSNGYDSPVVRALAAASFELRR